jgi:hypothetical protein
MKQNIKKLLNKVYNELTEFSGDHSRHGYCWEDMIYAFINSNEKYKNLDVNLMNSNEFKKAFVLFGVEAGWVIDEICN